MLAFAIDSLASRGRLVWRSRWFRNTWSWERRALRTDAGSPVEMGIYRSRKDSLHSLAWVLLSSHDIGYLGENATKRRNWFLLQDMAAEVKEYRLLAR
jgi:hypothetical protein